MRWLVLVVVCLSFSTDTYCGFGEGEKTAREIRKEAAKRWPDSYQMQEASIKNELEAHDKLVRIYNKLMKDGRALSDSKEDKEKLLFLSRKYQILTTALERWPESYQMALASYRNELMAYERLRSNK